MKKKKPLKFNPAKLKGLRQQFSITQAVLAESLDLHRQTIAAWETGKSQPTFEHLLAVAAFFRVGVDFFAEK